MMRTVVTLERGGKSAAFRIPPSLKATVEAKF